MTTESDARSARRCSSPARSAPASAGTFPVYDPAAADGHRATPPRPRPTTPSTRWRPPNQAWPAWAALSAAERTAICSRPSRDSTPTPTSAPRSCPARTARSGSRPRSTCMVFAGRFHQAAAVRPRARPGGAHRGPAVQHHDHQAPAGVVTIIYPFNWPLAILAASPARRADGRQHGDREAAAHHAAVVGAHAAAPVRALPPGVLNVVTGADDVVGPIVVGDPRIKHVCFTGSVGGGKRIMAMAAANLTNVTLELGGNDPAIVLDDAVLDEAAFAKMSGATFMTTGQVCMALKRLYVPRCRYDEVVDGLRATLENAGRPRPRPGHHDGPAQHAPGSATTSPGSPRRRAAAGAEVLSVRRVRRRRPPAATTCCPSLVLDPAPRLGIVAEEQFGPALPVIPYDNEEAGDRAGQRHLVRPVLIGVVGRHRARMSRQAAAHRRHVLQQPQRHRGRRARPVRRLQPERHRPRARPQGMRDSRRRT